MCLNDLSSSSVHGPDTASESDEADLRLLTFYDVFERGDPVALQVSALDLHDDAPGLAAAVLDVNENIVFHMFCSAKHVKVSAEDTFTVRLW